MLNVLIHRIQKYSICLGFLLVAQVVFAIYSLDTEYFEIIAPIEKPVPSPKLRYTYQDYYVIVNKPNFKVTVFKDTSVVKVYPCAVGLFWGDKQEVDDYRTPEGNFYVESIEASSDWEHDFVGDGLGPIKGAYGPWFYRLYTGSDSTKTGLGWKGIAIHGTHLPESIGNNVSAGCVRLNNKDIIDIKKYIKKGTPVRIER